MAAFFNQFILFVTPYWDQAMVIATSWEAWRVYALAAATFVLSVSFWIARKQQLWFKNLNPVSPIRGKPATRIGTLRRQIDQIEKPKGI